MKVYRYLSQNELDLILSNNISSIGCEYSQSEKYKYINNHEYKTGIKYLHFFKNKNDCKRVRFIRGYENVEFYVAEFNIPYTILSQHAGYGKYDRQGYGSDVEKVLEFAVPTSKFTSKYMCSYVRDEEHHRLLEESKELTDMIIKCKDIFKPSKSPELQKNSKKGNRLATKEREPDCENL